MKTQKSMNAVQLSLTYLQYLNRARKDLASGVMPMEAEDFPSFFWSGAMPGQDFDPGNMLHGLFKSYFLTRVSCLIS